MVFSNPPNCTAHKVQWAFVNCWGRVEFSKISANDGTIKKSLRTFMWATHFHQKSSPASINLNSNWFEFFGQSRGLLSSLNPQIMFRPIKLKPQTLTSGFFTWSSTANLSYFKLGSFTLFQLAWRTYMYHIFSIKCS